MHIRGDQPLRLVAPFALDQTLADSGPFPNIHPQGSPRYIRESVLGDERHQSTSPAALFSRNDPQPRLRVEVILTRRDPVLVDSLSDLVAERGERLTLHGPTVADPNPRNLAYLGVWIRTSEARTGPSRTPLTARNALTCGKARFSVCR